MITEEEKRKIGDAFDLVSEAYLREFNARLHIPFVDGKKALEKLKKAKALLDELLKSKLGEVA